MVCAGQECPQKYTPAQVGCATVRVLQRTVPVAIPGISFLSGGQSEDEATANLNAINSVPTALPWRLTFSYARALQNSVLKAWAGRAENVAAAQDVLVGRAAANSQASRGKFVRPTGGPAAAEESLYVKDYTY